MGLLDDIKVSDIGNSSRNGFFPLCDADYLVRIELCKEKAGNDKSGEAFISELEVLEAKYNGPGEAPNDFPEVGDFRDWYRATDVPAGQARKMAAKDLSTFLCAAAGFDPDVVVERERFFEQHGTGAKLQKAATADNALENVRLRLKTYPKKTKKGGDFTVHVWKPVEGASKAAAPPPPAPPPAPAADPRATWQESPCGNYLLDPAKNDWVAK